MCTSLSEASCLCLQDVTFYGVLMDFGSLAGLGNSHARHHQRFPLVLDGVLESYPDTSAPDSG